MSGDHYPECNQRPFADGSPSKAPDCICDRLRACKARVLSTAVGYKYRQGYAAALDAAREAVAAWFEANPVYLEGKHGYHQPEEVLAAIAALKKP